MKSLFHDERRTFLFFPSRLIFFFIIFLPFSRTALRSLLFGRIPKHTDSLFRSSFHVAFAFVKFLGRKTDGEATVLGSWRVEKLWPRCETSFVLFSARMSLPNSSRTIFLFFFQQNCFLTFWAGLKLFYCYYIYVHFQISFIDYNCQRYRYLIVCLAIYYQEECDGYYSIFSTWNPEVPFFAHSLTHPS